jgi:hypothetical protein
MRDPVLYVKQIYQFFGYTFTPLFEQNLLNWLAENPQGKQGRNAYNLEMFGYSESHIDKHYEKYTKQFL